MRHASCLKARRLYAFERGDVATHLKGDEGCPVRTSRKLKEVMERGRRKLRTERRNGVATGFAAPLRRKWNTLRMSIEPI